ncbi:peroxiredoxin [Nanchangia anserum]|uniref:thioredoxin-dependent peroxiredoxin n=1 Tax=Nanchangia anserum TaxID=2692125 RepID=A0A8I0GD13_9ACTO|nr:peroxiredoxin [Nanchangia anserum]MBD3689905.1 peroxiredoxin [Nanchangia anserum]QOX82278.1 peroxiredoxin [Nanchangia anserum]
MARLSVGQDAPDMTLDGIPSGPYRLHDLAASTTRGLVVYFYPRANTPGCTAEACDFRDSLASLRSSGYEVIGISPDRLAKLEAFADEHALSFPLASDPDHACMEAWGAWGEKTNYGRTSVGVIRSTIVIDPSGVVTAALYNVRAKGHVARLRRELGLDD